MKFLQVCGLALAEPPNSNDLYLLTEIERLELTKPLPKTLWCHATVRDADQIRPEAWHLDLALIEGSGAIVGHVSGASLRRASREVLRAAVAKQVGPADQTLYRLTWEPVQPVTRAAASLTEPKKFVAEIRGRFRDLSEQHRLSIYDQLLPELDQLSADHLAAALRQLGFDDSAGRTFTADVECRASRHIAAICSIVHAYARHAG